MNMYHLIPFAKKLTYEEWKEDYMSRKNRKNKMNDQVKEEIALVDRKVIGTNPDGTPIFEETDVFAQTSEHTGEAVPTP